MENNNIDPISKRQNELLKELGKGSRGFFLENLKQNLNLEDFLGKIVILKVKDSNWLN